MLARVLPTRVSVAGSSHAMPDRLAPFVQGITSDPEA
jgi:hypothetical protein